MRIEQLVHYRAWIPTIAQWHFEQWGRLTGFETLAEYTRFLEGAAQSPELPIILVALNGEEIVGSGSLLACDMEIRSHLMPWLAQLFVIPSYRGQGIGGALVRAVAEEAKRLKHSKLYLYTSGALPNYDERLGWTTCERVEYLGKERSVMQFDLSMLG